MAYSQGDTGCSMSRQPLERGLLDERISYNKGSATWVWFRINVCMTTMFWVFCVRLIHYRQVEVGTQRTLPLWAGVLATAGNLVFTGTR